VHGQSVDRCGHVHVVQIMTERVLLACSSMACTRSICVVCVYVCMCRVGQNHIRCIYGIYGREIIKHTVTYGVYIRLWLTLCMCAVGELDHEKARVLAGTYMARTWSIC